MFNRKEHSAKAGRAAAEARRKVWDSRRTEIVAVYSAGKFLREIAAQFGVSKPTIAAHLKRWGEFNSERVKPQQQAGKRIGGRLIDPTKHLARAFADETGRVKATEHTWCKHPEARHWAVNNTAAKQYIKRRQDPHFRALSAQRCRIWKWLRMSGTSKTRKTIQYLGCSREELVAHIEKQFTARMTWLNYGSVWELDHKRPCVSFDLSDPAQVAVCFHFLNLQPLTVRDNRVKQGRFNGVNMRR